MTNEQLNRRDAARISVENRIMKSVSPGIDLSTAKFPKVLDEWIADGKSEQAWEAVKRELRTLPGMLSMAPAVYDIEMTIVNMKFNRNVSQHVYIEQMNKAVRLLADHEQLAF